MKTKAVVIGILTLTAASASTALAGGVAWSVGVAGGQVAVGVAGGHRGPVASSVSVGVPIYVNPAPVYVAPPPAPVYAARPVCAQPAPVYYAYPPPLVVAPAPVCVRPPPVYGPRLYFGFQAGPIFRGHPDHGHGHGHRYGR